jgi:signal transduction histidine kinase
MSERLPRGALPLACVAAILVISFFDWMTPAGVVVGIFLSVPIILSSFAATPRTVGAVSVLAHVSFLVAAVFGSAAISPAAVWIPNRLFTVLTLTASTGVALLLQQSRQAAERERDRALAARDLNRLLMSLLAHDLRTPLVVAAHGLE